MAQTILESKIRLFGVLLLLSIITIMPQLASADVVFPSDAGVINVKDPSYGAKGNGITDDTAAIQKAVSYGLNLSKLKERTAIIYFPNGTYIVSNTILPKINSTAVGGWTSFLTLQGQHRDKTIIKLKDNAPGYNNKSSSKAVLYTASGSFVCKDISLGGNVEWISKGECNEAFNNNIFDLTVNTGTGNTGAIGIDYLASNNGEIRDVKIVSGDGQGYIGLALARRWQGPGLVKNLIIEGFDYGIGAVNTYTMTLEHITLKDQKVAGLFAITTTLAIRDLQSVNSVPAIIHDLSTSGLIVLVDGNLQGMGAASSLPAIDNRQGLLFVRNVTAPGYSSVIKNNGTTIPGASITEFYSLQDEPLYKYSLFDTPKKSLGLAVQDPPEVPWDPLDQWVSVQAYGADGSGNKSFDNSPAVQKAIDEANKLGKTTLYFPKGQYAFGDTIHINGSIRRVHVMMSSFGAVNSAANKFGDGRPSIAVEEGNHPAIVIEGGGRGFVTGATVFAKTGIKHISSKTLVLKNSGGTYENVVGSGPVFFEDMQGCSTFHSTNVWARQLDPEGCVAPGVDPMNLNSTKILNDGSDVWILGLKTEQPATIIETKNGGKTEVLGGWISPVKTVPPGMPAFRNIESSHSLSFVEESSGSQAFYETIIEETRGGETRNLTKSQLPPRGNGVMVPFYAGYIEGTLPPPLATADIIFPNDAGVINVKDYGAKGNGTTDDTAAIQKAVSYGLNLSKLKERLAIIYFPAGTYLVSNTILPKINSTAVGGWSPYLTLQGQHRDKTIIKLKDNAPGYSNKSAPKAVLFTASSQPDINFPGNWTGKGEGNSAFNNNIFDLTVDTGKGNPGAIGIDYLASNNGAVRDVKIVSGDGQGYIGLSLVRNSPGPALGKNVVIEGFDYGIASQHATYISTLEHITLRNQKIAGIYNLNHVFAIRDLLSENSVPIIIQEGESGFITLVDSNLQGTSSQSAIDNRQGEMFLRNVSAPGYSSVIKNNGTVIPGASITEFYSLQDEPLYKYSLFDTPKKSLGLAVQDPPEVPWDPLDQWVSVKDYGADGSGNKTFDNSPAVQKAIDEANKLGKTTLYFPKGQYAFGDTIRIYGSIRRLNHMMSSFGAVNSSANKFADGRPSIQIDEGTHPALLIEGGGRTFNTGATIGPKLKFKHISSKTLVVKNSGGSYENVVGSGPVFFEDMQSCAVFHSTKVWARQLNPEGCTTASNVTNLSVFFKSPKILNDGSDVWILGLKTEVAATIVETKNGGRTEVLGGMIYPSSWILPIPADLPVFRNTESSHSLSFVVTAYSLEESHQTIIEETRSGVTKQLNKSQVPPKGWGSMVPFFAGYIESALPPVPPPPPPVPPPPPSSICGGIVTSEQCCDYGYAACCK